MQWQIWLLMFWLGMVSIHRVCDKAQSVCVYLWSLFQGNSNFGEDNGVVLNQMASVINTTIADVSVGTASPGVESPESLWRNLIDNPSEWWDNRSSRRNPRTPDFKNKVTGKALWIDNYRTPAWV